MTTLTTALALYSLLYTLGVWLNHTQPPPPDPLWHALNHRPNAGALALGPPLQQTAAQLRSQAIAIKQFTEAAEAYRQAVTQLQRPKGEPWTSAPKNPRSRSNPSSNPSPTPNPHPPKNPPPKKRP